MLEHNIEIPCNTEVVIRVSCKAEEIAVEPLPNPPLTEPLPEPVIEPQPILPVEPEPLPSTPELPTVEPVLIPEPVIPTLPELPTPETPTIPDPISNPPVIEVPPILIPPLEPIPLPPVDPTPTPVIEIPTASEHCFCDLDSPLSIAELIKQLFALTKGLLYPSESDFPIEVLTKGFSSKMPPIKGIQIRTLDRVIPTFFRNVDPDDQQTGNVERAALADRWMTLYKFIKANCSVTAWHYPVKGKKYTHEMLVILLHNQGTVALRIKLVET